MKRSRRKIYLAVIAVGIGALILDRVMTSRAPAPAAGAPPAAPVSNGRTGTGAANERLLVNVPNFPGVPPQDAPSTGRSDPFAIAPATVAALAPPTPASQDPDAPAADAPKARRAAIFAADHVLSAVMRVGRSSVAVVDGLSVEIGHVIDDCRVTRIDARSVTFTCADGEAVLELAPPLGPPKASAELAPPTGPPAAPAQESAGSAND